MGQTLCILHLEDSPEDRELVEWALDKAGLPHQTTAVANKRDFVRALTEQTIDLVISDCNVFGLAGEDAIALARSHNPRMPFIALTGQNSPHVSARLLANGADAVACKEQLGSLADEIRRVLGHRIEE